MKIAVDFDGTCTTHEFPEIGKDIGAVSVLKKLVEKGHQLILFTMRADRIHNNPTEDPTIQDRIGTFLADAIKWFEDNNIPLYGIQADPGQENWTSSPKAYAQLYIDDCGLGAPLIYGDLSERPYIDWIKTEQILKMRGIL